MRRSLKLTIERWMSGTEDVKVFKLAYFKNDSNFLAYSDSTGIVVLIYLCIYAIFEINYFAKFSLFNIFSIDS